MWRWKHTHLGVELGPGEAVFQRRHKASEIFAGLFPVSMDERVAARETEEQLQFSTHSSSGGGRSGPGTGSKAMYHGHGEGEEKIAADRKMHVTRVGRMIADAVYNTDHPLVVLATKEVAGHFIST